MVIHCDGEALGSVRAELSGCCHRVFAGLCWRVCGLLVVSQDGGLSAYLLLPRDGCGRTRDGGLQAHRRAFTECSFDRLYRDPQGVFRGDGHLVRNALWTSTVLCGADAVGGFVCRVDDLLLGKVGGEVREGGFALLLLLPDDGGRGAIACREGHVIVYADRIGG